MTYKEVQSLALKGDNMEKYEINEYTSAYILDEFVVKSGRWIVNLANVDFMTYRANEKIHGAYLVTMHIGDKEVKVMADHIYAVKELFLRWATANNKKLEIEAGDLVGTNQ